MLKLTKQFVFIALILFAIPAFSQSKKALQEKKAQIKKDITYTNKLLARTKKTQKKLIRFKYILLPHSTILLSSVLSGL